MQQGIGWMYQLLPYLEEGAVKDVVLQSQLDDHVISIYNCPSRRSNARTSAGIQRVDYAGATAGPSRSEIRNLFDTYLQNPANYDKEIFWGCSTCFSTLPSATTVAAMAASGTPVQFRGIIQRVDWQPPPVAKHMGFTRKISFQQITDGASKTLLVSEKWVHVAQYEAIPEPLADNRGWADGWDYDHMRSCMFAPRPDGEGQEPDGSVSDPANYPFGAAHSGGINSVFADGAVHFIAYDIDRETFNRLGHRHDGEVASFDL
jgi:hypothetical protein